MAIKIQNVTVIDDSRYANNLTSINIPNSSFKYIKLQANTSSSTNNTFILPDSITANGSLHVESNGKMSFKPTLPIGSIRSSADSSQVVNTQGTWLLCNGTIYNQSAYPDLFSKIGINEDSAAMSSVTSTWWGRTVNAAGFGNGIYLMGGGSGSPGSILTSTDAINWTTPVSTTTAINVITYGNGIYLAGMTSGKLVTSTNAINWSLVTTAAAGNIQALTYGNGIYVMGTSSSEIYTSTDAANWTARTSGTTSNILSLTYGNGIYVYGTQTGGGQSGIYSSTNAINWSLVDTSPNSSTNALIYADGIFVYGGQSGALATSTNGTNWTDRTSGTVGNINDMAYGNGLFVYVTNGPEIGTSTNGINWVNRGAVGANDVINAITYGNFKFPHGLTSQGQIRVFTGFSYDTTTQFATPIANTSYNFIQSENTYIKAL